MEFAPKKVDNNSEWVIIIGSAGAVGSFAVQVYFYSLGKTASELISCTDRTPLWLQSASGLFSKRHQGTPSSQLH
jgi:NADPH:quinone reductase-like Zn-dependent oxidoreductase